MKTINIPFIGNTTYSQLLVFAVSIPISFVVMSVVSATWPGWSLFVLMVLALAGFVTMFNPFPDKMLRARAAYPGFVIGWVLASLREMYFGAGANYF